MITLTVSGTPLDAAEVGIQIVKATNMGARGTPSTRSETWAINGWIKADSETELAAKMAIRENLFSGSSSVDLVLKRSTGAITHQLLSNDALQGTRARQFRWLAGNPRYWGMGTELVLMRSYSVVVDAVYAVAGGDNLLRYSETLRFIGTGGARKVLRGSFTGPMQEQYPQLITKISAIQSGTAVGLFSYPDFPQYAFFDRLDAETHTQEWGTPRNMSNLQSTEWPISWRYVYHSAGLLQGTPTLPL